MVDGEFDFYVLRKPEKNPKVTWKKKLEILWRPELAQFQTWNQMPKYKGKSKLFVIGKITEKIPDKIDEKLAEKQISQLLFERDYTTVAENLAEYRKGEIQKQIDMEKNPQKQIELMMEREVVKANLRKKKRKKCR